MLWLITFSCFMYFFTSITALRCIIENSTMRKSAIENCSSSVTDCFLFKCDKSGTETNEKGCNDNLSNFWNCQALGEACVQAGGRACCDTCAEDLCNNAIVFVSRIPFAILSVSFALSITVYI